MNMALNDNNNFGNTIRTNNTINQTESSFLVSDDNSFSFQKDAFNNLAHIESFPGSAKNEFAHFLSLNLDK